MSSTHPPDEDNPPILLGGSRKLATFGPEQLKIVYGHDNSYWKMPPEGSIGVPAELVQVCWLEVRGSVRSAVKGNRYKISFAISLKPDAFGWDDCPVYVMAKCGKESKYSWKKIMLQQGKLEIGDLEIEYKDGINISASGIGSGSGNETIYFGLYEVWSGQWKGGLLLHSATVQQLPP